MGSQGVAAWVFLHEWEGVHLGNLRGEGHLRQREQHMQSGQWETLLGLFCWNKLEVFPLNQGPLAAIVPSMSNTRQSLETLHKPLHAAVPEIHLCTYLLHTPQISFFCLSELCFCYLQPQESGVEEWWRSEVRLNWNEGPASEMETPILRRDKTTLQTGRGERVLPGAGPAVIPSHCLSSGRAGMADTHDSWLFLITCFSCFGENNSTLKKLSLLFFKTLFLVQF